MKPNEIVEALKGYMGSKDPHYAVMLTGQWGVGKTCFVSHVLSNAFADAGVGKVLRVSLAGAKDAEDVSQRLVRESLLAGIPMPDDKPTSTRSIAETAFGAVRSFISNKLKGVGLSVELPSNALAGIFLTDMNLVVFDDFERCPELDPGEMAGMLAFLLEERGLHVLIVCNEDEMPDGQEFGDAMRGLEEKYIWKKIAFEQDWHDVVPRVVGGFNGIGDRKDAVSEAAISGLEHTGGNIRSLIKSRAVVEAVAGSDFMGDSAIDARRKREVLGAVVQLSLMAAAGAPPRHDDNIDQVGNMAAFGEGLVDVDQESLFLQYSKLAFLDSYFNTHEELDPREIDRQLRQFCDSEYPESQVEIKALEGSSKFRNMMLLEDEELLEAVSWIMEAFDAEDVNVENIPDLLSSLNQAEGIGLLEPGKYDEALEHAESIVLRDPRASIAIVAGGYYLWNADGRLGLGKKVGESIAALRERAWDAYKSEWATLVRDYVDCGDASSGEALVRVMSADSAVLAEVGTSLPVEWVGKCVKHSSSASLYEMRRFFTGERGYIEIVRNSHGSMPAIADWLVRLAEGVEQIQVESKIRGFHIRKFAEELKAASARLGGLQ